MVAIALQRLVMSLKDRISADIKAAMKAKDKIRLETVRSVKKAILEKEVSIRPSGREVLDESEELDVLGQLAKQRKDAITQYRAAGRDDLADREDRELAILQTYLPPALSPAELQSAIEGIVTQLEATSMKDMGRVMQAAMQQFKGRADGSAVQQLVKAKLIELG